MENCLFCSMIEKKVAAEIVYEDDLMIIIKDIAPKAKEHYLLIPKRHFSTILEATENDMILLQRCLSKIKYLVHVLHLEQGFRLIINQGEHAGQTIHHLHVHILSGEPLPW